MLIWTLICISQMSTGSLCCLLSRKDWSPRDFGNFQDLNSNDHLWLLLPASSEFHSPLFCLPLFLYFALAIDPNVEIMFFLWLSSKDRPSIQGFSTCSRLHFRMWRLLHLNGTHSFSEHSLVLSHVIQACTFSLPPILSLLLLFHKQKLYSSLSF